MIARYHQALKNETTAGVVLIIGAVLALIWANFPVQGARNAYDSLANTSLFELHGHGMSLSLISADFLLALFFFIVGMELKQEFVVGSLRDIRKALVPILAAVLGMIGPVLVYVTIQLLSADPNWNGWAVPVATDIAFALGVLGLFGKGLPIALRTFLMTLAVVDDLLGILIIAVFFSDNLNFIYLGLSILVVAAFGTLAQKRIIKWYLLWPIGLVAWYFMFSSGIHATIAGVLMGMTIPAKKLATEKLPLTEELTEKLEFYSAGIILPVFAFFAAGVNVVDSGGVMAMLTDPAAMGIYLGLPLGKMIGITGGVALMVYVFKLQLGKNLYMGDVNAIAFIAGIGFTVSLLIATLSFPDHDPAGPHARVAVLLGTLISLVVGAFFLRGRAKWHRHHAPVYDYEHMTENRATLERHEVLADDTIEESWGEVPGGEPEVGPGHYDR